MPEVLTPPPLAADDAETLIKWLETRDAACPVCRYNLRGLTGAKCPECAAALHLQVGSENLRLGPWILAITAPTLGLGFDGVMSIITMGQRILQPPKAPILMTVLVLLSAVFFVLAAACASGLLVLIRSRGAWTRMPLRKQWMWGSAIFVGVGVAHAIVGAVLVQKVL